MPRSVRTPNAKRRLVWLGTVVALLAVAGGWVMAASSFEVSQGNTEYGGGTVHSTQSIAWWSESDVGLGAIPSGTFTQLSTTPNPATTLGAGAATYTIGSTTAGDIMHYWVFDEAAGAPTGTVLELSFTVSTGTTPSVTTTTVYVETQGTSPTGSIAFTMLYDLGTPGPGTPVVLNSVTEISLQCTTVSSVTTCP